MGNETKAGVTSGIVILLLGLAILGGIFLFKRHDMAQHHYAAGSVCEHQFDLSHEFMFSALNHASTPPQDLNGWSTSESDAVANETVAAQQAQIDQFNAIFNGISVANSALAARGQKPLFCLSPPQPTLFQTYWAATQARLNQDPQVCARDYATDILIYLQAAYPCRASAAPSPATLPARPPG